MRQQRGVNNGTRPTGIGGGISANSGIGGGSKLQKSGIGRGIGGGVSSMSNTMYNNPGQQNIMQSTSISNLHQQQEDQLQQQTFAEQNKQRAMKTAEQKALKKEQQIDQMSMEEILNELKDKRLPTYGTAQERRDRLKKQYGIAPKSKSQIGTTTANPGSMVEPPLMKKGSTTDKIDQIKINRDARRLKMEEMRKLKSEREAHNDLHGIKVDVDFQVMVEDERKKLKQGKMHSFADQMHISVCFKKRPVFQSELADGEIDVISVVNPKIIVHDCRYKVDGVSKTIVNEDFKFDNCFDDEEEAEELYFYQVRPIMDLIFNQGIVTIFAYGQTGSGKTYTMNGLQSVAVKDLFERGIDYWENHQRNFTVTVSMYEIYGGKLYDLLNEHSQLSLREDKNNTIQIAGLKEQFVDNDDQILELITQGNQMRTTHATKANDTSSRSHAITQIKIQEQGVKNCGKLLLVDLAGSERAQDCQSNNKDRQAEGSEINQSLLALKECIRSLDQQKGQAGQGQHVPFRQSKLTMVLRDSFMANDKCKIVMLTCICPGMSSANHTLNSLRYAERLKEKTSQGGQGGSKFKSPPSEQVQEELRAFLERHGKSPLNRQEEDEQDFNNNMFYQDDEIEDNDDMLLGDDQEMQMLQEMEDQEAAVMQKQFAKKSPQPIKSKSTVVSAANTRQQNQSNVGVANQRRATHQNQFSKQPPAKMSPAPPKSKAISNPRSAKNYREEAPQQQMNPPAPLMSSQMPLHPNKKDQEMFEEENIENMMDSQLMEEERMRAEENIYNTHLDAVKEEVQLIQREGEMITTLERAIKNEEDYDMREYLASARQIAMQKIQMYQQLMQNIDEFQNTFISK